MFIRPQTLLRVLDRAALCKFRLSKPALGAQALLRCMAESASSGSKPTKRLTSEFLLQQPRSTTFPTVLVILNWTLPKRTARLWGNGEQQTRPVLRSLPYCLTNSVTRDYRPVQQPAVQSQLTLRASPLLLQRRSGCARMAAPTACLTWCRRCSLRRMRRPSGTDSCRTSYAVRGAATGLQHWLRAA